MKKKSRVEFSKCEPVRPESDLQTQLLESSLDIVCASDRQGKFVWVNTASERLWGYCPEELIGSDYLQFVHPADHANTIAISKEILKGQDLTHFENRYIHKNGSIVDMSWSATWNEESQLMYSVAKDITEQKYQKEQLQYSEHQLRMAMGRAKMGLWEFETADGKVTWTDEIYVLYGVDKTRTSGNLMELFMSLLHPDDVESFTQHLGIVPTQDYQFTHRIIRPDGKMIHVSQAITWVQNDENQVIKVTGITQDITDTFRYQQEIESSEKRFRSLVQNGSDLIGIIDSAGNYLFIADNAQHLLGYKSEHFIGKNAFDFIHPNDAQAVYNQLSQIFNKTYLELPPFRFRGGDGEWRWIETKATNMLDDEAIKGIIVNSRDVTENKIAQDRIKELSRLIEETSNMVVITDSSGKITWVNAAFTRTSGFKLKEVKGKKPGHLLQGPDSDPATIAYMRERILKGKSFEAEIINYTKDKQPYWMQIQCQPQYDSQGVITGFFAIQTDITENKRLQRQLQAEQERRQKKITHAMVKAQEIERTDIGNELHDNVNQILSTVKLYLGLAKDGDSIGEELIPKSIDLIQQCIDEIRKVSKRLSTPQLHESSLEDLVGELIDSIAIAGKMNFTYKPYNLAGIELDHDAQLAIYRIIQEHLTNVLKHSEASDVIVTLIQITNKLNLNIHDNGKGFDTTHKRKGIGISNMMNRAITIDGQLEVISRPGEGCTLQASFPLSNKV